MTRAATTPITMPAMAPPERPLSLLELSEEEEEDEDEEDAVLVERKPELGDVAEVPPEDVLEGIEEVVVIRLDTTEVNTVVDDGELPRTEVTVTTGGACVIVTIGFSYICSCGSRWTL